jgi:1-acyl-sn-glycerol-3-phosphate acyltransferase
MLSTAIFANEPQQRGRGIAATLGRLTLWLLRWRANVPVSLPSSYVMIVYPHTSNWDFPIGLACKWASGLHIHYLGKDTLFRSPLGWLFRATGGVAVDRTNPAGAVDAFAAMFKRSAHMRLAIAPEGTRSYTPFWKSGFYRITLRSDVPLVCATIDYRRKHVGVLEVITLSGDVATDITALRRIYAGVQGYRPQQMAPISLPDDTRDVGARP